MLGILCGRPKSWLFATLSHGVAFSHLHRFVESPKFKPGLLNSVDRRRNHSTNCRVQSSGAAASIWHAILPSPRTVIHHRDYELMRKKGEGSWNAAWDVRPARWLHNRDSAWLLFGVCACLACPIPHFVSKSTAPFEFPDPDPNPNQEVNCFNDQGALTSSEIIAVDQSFENNYKVKGVPADGRCLFRAIAHMACLRNGEEAPDDNRQRELADELRARVVDELLRRREEAEWFIEGDFDVYVKRIQQPYVWGGEPELLMASHVLKTPISVFMSDRSSGELTKIANYGEDYKKDDESSINVLFHGYGHYDILEIVDRGHPEQKVEE